MVRILAFTVVIQVQSMIRELRSLKAHGPAKKSKHVIFYLQNLLGMITALHFLRRNTERFAQNCLADFDKRYIP